MMQLLWSEPDHGSAATITAVPNETRSSGYDTTTTRTDDLLRCPHCHRWHPLVLRNVVKSTSYAKTCCSGNAARAVASTMPVNSVSPVDSKHADREIYRVGYHGPMPRKRERKSSIVGDELRASSSGPPERPIHPNIHESLIQAIKNKNFVTLVMRDHTEESGEPHVYGMP
jgi:hypothetical protein